MKPAPADFVFRHFNRKFDYDSDGVIADIRGSANNINRLYLNGIAYNAAGQMTRMRLGNGKTLTPGIGLAVWKASKDRMKYILIVMIGLIFSTTAVSQEVGKKDLKFDVKVDSVKRIVREGFTENPSIVFFEVSARGTLLNRGVVPAILRRRDDVTVVPTLWLFSSGSGDWFNAGRQEVERSSRLMSEASWCDLLSRLDTPFPDSKATLILQPGESNEFDASFWIRIPRDREKRDGTGKSLQILDPENIRVTLSAELWGYEAHKDAACDVLTNDYRELGEILKARWRKFGDLAVADVDSAPFGLGAVSGDIK